jgi:hypothetical protein
MDSRLDNTNTKMNPFAKEAKVSGRLKDSVMTVASQLERREPTTLNGPEFRFTEALSFILNYEMQEAQSFWRVDSID